MILVRNTASVRVFALCLAALLGLPGLLLGDLERFEGKPVVSITFTPDVQPLSESEALDRLSLRVGAPLTADGVREAIRRLYATGHYEDIAIEGIDAPPGVALRIATRASWFVGSVNVDGQISSPPNASQIANAAGLQLGAPFFEEEMERSLRSVRETLLQNGLFDATVSFTVDRDAARQLANITLHVDSGRRARFTAPRLEGELETDAARIERATRWRIPIAGWRPMTQSRVDRGLDRIRSLYLKQDRLQAAVTLSRMEYDPERRLARPLVRIEPGKPFTVRAVGMKVPSARLRRMVPIYEERSVDQDLLVEGVRNIRDWLQSSGYFRAAVGFERLEDASGNAVIEYRIDRGQLFRVDRVRITGNTAFAEDEIRDRLLVTERSLQHRYGRYSEGQRRRDEAAIAELYRSNGFRDVRVTAETRDDPGPKKGGLDVTYRIEEGRRWFVDTLKISGIPPDEAAVVRAKLAAVDSVPFSEDSVAADRDTILAGYFEKGYPDASFQWTATSGPRPETVDLDYTITKGRQQFVRDVFVTGYSTTRPSLIARNVLLGSGDALSPVTMADTQRSLYNLGVFAKVNMAVENPDGSTDRKDVLYQIEEASKYSVTGGLGAEVARIGRPSDLSAPGGATGFAPRVLLDLSRLNFLGTGHTISLRGRVSTLQQRALLNYTAPRVANDPDLKLSFTGLYDLSRDVRTFSASRLEGSVQLYQRLSRASTALYRFSYRGVRVDPNTLNINPLLVPLLSQPVRVGILSGNFIQDRRDDPTDAHRGVYNTLDLGAASRFFGSQTDFLRVLARNSTYHPIGKKLVFARSVTGGVLHAYRVSSRFGPSDSFDRSQAIPLSERFFSGGGTSHRGFPENQAGPRDFTTGFPLGGQALFFHNSELRFPLTGDNLGGVLFHDAGNVFSEIGKFSFGVRQPSLQDFDYMVHAVGFGLRYRTPIGPLRLDFGYSINSPRFNGFQGTREELLRCGTAATPTCTSVAQRISRFQFHFSIGQSF